MLIIKTLKKNIQLLVKYEKEAPHYWSMWHIPEEKNDLTFPFFSVVFLCFLP